MDPNLERAITMQTPDPEATSALLAALLAHPGIMLGLRERRRQVEDLAFTLTHDATRQSPMQLARAASCMIRQALLITTQGVGAGPKNPFLEWPWPRDTWHPPHTTVEALVKAIALLAAELDQIIAGQRRETTAARLDDPN